MTIIKNIAFPTGPTPLKNYGITEFEEDPANGDTEVVESMAGITFRNGRRATLPRKFRLTIWGAQNSTEWQAVLALKATVKGRLYGFKFTPVGETTALDVCFSADDWTYSVIEPTEDNAARCIKADINLEQVIGGTPE